MSVDIFNSMRNTISSNMVSRGDLADQLHEYNRARDRVDISLDRYESMMNAIEKLTKESCEWKQKFETLCAFLDETHLPLDALGSGKGQDIKWETQINPMNMSVRYNISVTVPDVDLYRHERARLYTENEQINED
jgi:hypothetical protein